MANKKHFSWAVFAGGLIVLVGNAGLLLGFLPETYGTIDVHTSVMASSALIGGLLAVQEMF